MTIYSKNTLAAAMLVLFAAPGVQAEDCGITGGAVSIVGNEFPAIQSVVAKAGSCDSIDFKSNLTADHQKINVDGMKANPPAYTSAIIANSSIVALINEDVIQPLDDLLAEHGEGITDNQKITIDGKVMAIAFMANSQHLVYREDILTELGIQVPTSYEEVLMAAEKIRASGKMQHPVGGAYMSGWNLAQEFVNMYIGHGGSFYEPGTASVSINNEQGVGALEMMKQLSAYMNPDFLTHDSNATNAEWEAGNIALMNMWGSRAGVLMDDEGAEQMVYENTKVSGPLMVGDSGVPATTLWWDGWTIAKNASPDDAAATFLALKNGISPGMLNEQTMGEAVWIIDGYEPAPVNQGVFASIEAGSVPYPMLPYHGLLHTALGDNISDFLQGKESAEQALSDIEAAYTAAAKEQGFLN